MKRISIFLASLFAIVSNTTPLWAQTPQYETLTFDHNGIEEIHSTLPTKISITPAESGTITITFPSEAIPYIDFDLNHVDNVLSIKHSKSYKSRSELNSVSEEHPIEVCVPTNSLRNIMNTSDMSISFESGDVGARFQIINTGSMFIHGKALNAKIKIEYYNTGTMTNYVENHNTELLCLTNTGFLLTKGNTTAKYVEQNSTGIENCNLCVACQKVVITSTGSGTINYRGTSDEVEVITTGTATIRTSELTAN